jgi:uncharacterized membrane protein YdjX (TVP38/TMEM64 family)
VVISLNLNEEKKMANYTYQRNSWWFIIVLAVIVLAWAVSRNYIMLESVKEMRTSLKLYVDKHYIFSVFMFMLAYMVAAAFSLPISVLLTLTGGFLFGTWHGFLFSATAATAGATLAFLIIRFLWTKVHTIFSGETMRLIEIKEELVRAGFWYLLALRLFTLIPFFLVTLLAALSPIRLTDFVVATAIGIMPACLLFSYAGSQLAQINSVSDVLTPTMIMLFVALAFLSLIPALFRSGRNSV